MKDQIIRKMDTESSIAIRSHKENCDSLVEVSNVERQMWIFVQSKGLLSADVRNIYRKACSLYEKIFLRNSKLEELQETEYSLWKLHYKQIDEFRKQTSQCVETNQEGFKSFLEESSRFYRDLISKFKRRYGFKDLDLFYHSHIDEKLHKCRLVSHRLLVRLGDLARYLEVNQNCGFRQRNWSSVSQCYFEAAKVYPDGGNPQNQLALLATPAYIGDEFLALYHCVRSMAVKEPFPDASDNLLFIFERNMSVHIHLLSAGSQFDFRKPSERVMKTVPAPDADFWSLFVRITSFFFLEFSFESLSRTFASAIRQLEAFLALDDDKLTLGLESYKSVNISRPGPYRALQAVSILIFTIHNLSGNHELQSLKKQQMALIVTFICIGRIVERCSRFISTDNSPFLPTVMVFSEWLVEFLERLEESEIDESLMTAMSYFFSSHVELLNQLLEGKKKTPESPNHVALWEDYELRGFIPVSQCHTSLDFSGHWESEANFRARNEHRIQRIIHAAIKIAKSSRWILYKEGGKFCTKEEEIVFKPVDRYNSESGKGLKQLVSDESLRYESSLLIAQNRALISSMMGPPSLSAWVLNHNNTKEDILKSINEISTSSANAKCSSSNYDYCPPTPSARLLPEGLSLNQQRRKEASTRSGHFEERYPLIPIPALYTESSTFVSELYKQRRETTGSNDQQQLLQYLKEKEWRIQREARITHYKTGS